MTPADEFTDIRIRLGARDPDDPALEDMLARLQVLYDAVRRENRAVREQLGRLLHDAAAKQDELNAALVMATEVNGRLLAKVEDANGQIAIANAFIASGHEQLLATARETASGLHDRHRQSYTAVVDERREGR